MSSRNREKENRKTVKTVKDNITLSGLCLLLQLYSKTKFDFPSHPIARGQPHIAPFFTFTLIDSTKRSLRNLNHAIAPLPHNEDIAALCPAGKTKQVSDRAISCPSHLETNMLADNGWPSNYYGYYYFIICTGVLFHQTRTTIHGYCPSR